MYSLYETESGGFCIINDSSRFMLNSTKDKYKARLICYGLNEGILYEAEVSDIDDVNELVDLYKSRVRR